MTALCCCYSSIFYYTLSFKVGSRTTYRHTHCICRAGQPETSLENTAQSISLPRDIQKSRVPRAVKTNTFTRKGTFKISIGGKLFRTVKSIHLEIPLIFTPFLAFYETLVTDNKDKKHKIQ